MTLISLLAFLTIPADQQPGQVRDTQSAPAIVGLYCSDGRVVLLQGAALLAGQLTELSSSSLLRDLTELYEVHCSVAAEDASDFESLPALSHAFGPFRFITRVACGRATVCDSNYTRSCFCLPTSSKRCPT